MRLIRTQQISRPEGSRFHKIPYANIFLCILTYERQSGKSVSAPGGWFGLSSKAASLYQPALRSMHWPNRTCLSLGEVRNGLAFVQVGIIVALPRHKNA